MTVETQAATKEKKGLLGGLLGGAKSIWMVATVCALLAVFGALSILSDAAATTTYYVLGRDVPARTQITPDMLVPVETSVDGAPVNGYDVVTVSREAVFSKVPLETGDLVTGSNAGPLERITASLPGNFVAASFQVTPENAVAGKVRAGDHVDLIAVNDDAAGQSAKIVLHNVLVLDVAVAPSTIAEAANEGQAGAKVANPGPESEAVRSGIPQVYTVGVSPEDATKLALVRSLNLMVVLTGNDAPKSLDVQSRLASIFGSGAVGDSGAGTPGAIKGADTAVTEPADTPSADPAAIDEADPAAAAPDAGN